MKKISETTPNALTMTMTTSTSKATSSSGNLYTQDDAQLLDDDEDDEYIYQEAQRRDGDVAQDRLHDEENDYHCVRAPTPHPTDHGLLHRVPAQKTITQMPTLNYVLRKRRTVLSRSVGVFPKQQDIQDQEDLEMNEENIKDDAQRLDDDDDDEHIQGHIQLRQFIHPRRRPTA